MNDRIWLSLAHMGGGEQKYIKEAFDTNWVVPLGPNVDALERELADYLGENSCVVALTSGTSALHLALVMLDIKRGDEVLCQSFTFTASANPIVYTGATPIFVDSEPDTWNISPEWLEKAIKDRISQTGRVPKAIIVVDLYGMPARMAEIMEIADRYAIPVIEDAAEALGSEYKGQKCGTFGRFGVLSFNGNKIITTSGGGALVCRSEEEAARVKFFATQARENRPYYYHEYIGYNYRMSNICAGIGRGQMEVLPGHVRRRQAIHSLYAEGLKDIEGIEVMSAVSDSFSSNYWLSCITIEPDIAGVTAEDLRQDLERANIESRLLWRAMHLQPVYASSPFYGDGTSEELFDRGLCLPSGSSLTDEQIGIVVNAIRRAARRG